MDLFLFLARGPAVYVRTYSSLSGGGEMGLASKLHYRMKNGFAGRRGATIGVYHTFWLAINDYQWLLVAISDFGDY